jgi:2-iminobutanoate/2-iminopropanoate deaminase
MKKAIQTPLAPAAIGPYSQAIEAGDMIFCSGQLGLDPGTGGLVAGGVAAETRRALENLTEVLRVAGLGLKDVVETTIFVADLRDFDVVNRIYGEHFKEPYPSRSTVQAGGLARGARVEIGAIAVRSSQVS